MTTAKRATGDAFEAKALDFLERAGLRLVAKNWSCRAGEIDLVMRDGETLVFVEVRKRSSLRFGGALQSIDAGKSKRLTLAVDAYLSRLPRVPQVRVDAIGFDANDQPQWTKHLLG